jgi:uncharacterized protein YjiS (DUF1127 family)
VSRFRLSAAVRLIAEIWWRRARTRKALRELDTRLLADIGLTRLERQMECA